MNGKNHRLFKLFNDQWSALQRLKEMLKMLAKEMLKI